MENGFDELTNRQVTDKKESVSLKVTNNYNEKNEFKRKNRTPTTPFSTTSFSLERVILGS